MDETLEIQASGAIDVHGRFVLHFPASFHVTTALEMKTNMEVRMASIACSIGLALLGAFGVSTLFQPRVVMNGIGIHVEGGAGMAEIQALLGAVPLALAGWAAYAWSPDAIIAAALLPLFAGLTKAATGIIDRESRRANLISAAADVTLASLILAGAFAA